uniref:Glycoside hydrolase family 5 domain-containing protein n=1 Tax=Tetradesmus obliquus TaxID=3088 RepID=A0A383VF90_TETOB|eukprot:jgi/Sobl393_1/18464/SZX64228.1
MVAIHDEDGTVRLVGCAPLYRVPQTKWTPRLTVQVTLYMLMITMSMAAGGLMPWLLERFLGWSIGDNRSLAKMFAQDQGYAYDNNNTYAFCPKNARVFSYQPLARGYPAPPLAPKAGKLYDAWFHKPVVLRGVSWFGFNNAQGGPDGLWAGGSEAATDFGAIAYQLKLLGFNTIRLPFTFDGLRTHGSNLVFKCNHTDTRGLAQHATDPSASPQPDLSLVPDPPIHLPVASYHQGLCNTYMPPNTEHVIQRLLWTVQFLVANGFYVVLDYHPDASDATPLDAQDFARAWMYTWATITCLPNFASDIRGRILLDLLNEPDKAGGVGLGWAGRDGLPGLDELYLTTMDSIENITAADALYLLQGSPLSASGSSYGLSSGDGFVTDPATIQRHNLSDPRPFFNELLQREYRSRVLLGPHLYGPDSGGAAAAPAAEVLARLSSSWGRLAREGYCNGRDCMRLPVVVGEMGSRLGSSAELEYYSAVASLAQQRDSPLAGWIWWACNANSAATGGLVTDDWQEFAWPKIQFLQKHFGLQPWYSDTDSFLTSVAAQQQDAVKARAAADAAAAEEAAAAAAAAAANPALNLTTITETVVPVKAAGEGDSVGPASSSSSSSIGAGSKAGATAASSSVSAAGGRTQLADVHEAIKPAGSVAGQQAAQAAAPVQQANTADASYVQFDVQPPPAIVAGVAAASTAGSSAAAPAAAISSKLRSTQLRSQAAQAAAPAQLVDTHAKLPASLLDAGSALLLEVQGTVEEEPI